jgi:hypothetical protein
LLWQSLPFLDRFVYKSQVHLQGSDILSKQVLREGNLRKKSKQLKKQKISAGKFTADFTKLVSAHLANLSPEEQDKRIRAAHRRATRSRGASATMRGVADTPETRLSARTRE